MKTKRQGLRVTIGQLRRIADELEKDSRKLFKEVGASFPTFVAIHQQIHQINIINDTPNCSDTWEIEE